MAKVEDIHVNVHIDENEVKTLYDLDKIAQMAKTSDVINNFHKLLYPLQFTCQWMGHEICKNPLDLHIYQEILYETRPDLIIESGTFKGGSALFLANMCDLLHHGVVLTIDTNQSPTSPLHPRINYVIGSSIDEKVISLVDSMCNSVKRIMVILDSDHAKQHVLDEMEIYSNYVTRGQYLIVEDSNVHGHPVREDHPAGPYEAIEEFMRDPKHNADFIIDKACERLLVTFNINGYLRKMR